MLKFLSYIAVFSFTSLVYSVVEFPNAEAEVTVQLEQGNCLADIQVTVETVGGGTATGMEFKINVTTAYDM